MINEVLHGDCLDVLKTFPDNYFDSLVTDPPAGINFMSKKWDDDKGGMLNWINWLSEIMNEAMRTMKPGAIGLVWSIPRTSHWTGMALELAGFRIIDIVHHANGGGFPKSQDVSKIIDKMLGEEREIIGYTRQGTRSMFDGGKPRAASLWEGWKTPALKPAIEGWWMVQKKCSESSIVRNILKHGTGGLNIEAGRIGNNKRVPCGFSKRENTNIYNSGLGKENGSEDGHNPNIGRYPANLVLSCGINCQENNHSSDCPITVIGDQSGESVSKANITSDNRKELFYSSERKEKGIGEHNPSNSHSDKGTSARYFKQLPFDTDTVNSIYYKSKASTTDRTCKGLVNNDHPTVKSRHLMAYFIKLITPPNGIVLDPFGGSGTTAVSAIETGFNYVLIEKEEKSLGIINNRIKATKKKIEQLELTNN